MNIINESELLEAIRYECFKAKGQKNFAKLKTLSESALSQVLNSKRKPTDAMVKAAGYELRYVKVGS